jgi:hypothetical protein
MGEKYAKNEQKLIKNEQNEKWIIAQTIIHF